jgi:hypothetical protein
MLFDDTFKFIDIEHLSDDPIQFLEIMSEQLFYYATSPLLVSIKVDSLKELILHPNILNEEKTMRYLKHLLGTFKQIYMSIFYSKLYDEQKGNIIKSLNKILNLYMLGLLEDENYQINDMSDVNPKLNLLLITWENIIKVHHILFSHDIGDMNERYDIIIREINEKSKQMLHIDKFIQSYEIENIGLHSDVCGFYFMIIQICSKLLNNRLFLHKQHFIYELFVLSCDSILYGDNPDRMEILNNIFKHEFRKELKELCLGGMCSIMGGKKRRTTRKKR